MVKPLDPGKLYHHADPEQFSFETTAELEALDQIIGQERAVDAIRFGIGIRRKGYNLFALGPKGTGKDTAVHQYLADKAAKEPKPPDWCYVYNFEQAYQPLALQLPAGEGITLKEAMEHLVDELFTVIPAAFESEEYHSQRQLLEEDIQQQQEDALEALNQRARERDITMVRTQTGLAFAPLKDGEVIAPDEFMKLPQEEQDRVQKETGELQEELQKIMRQVPQARRELSERLKELNQEVASFAIAPLFEELRQKYSEHPEILNYFEAVQKDVTDNVDQFLQQEQPQIAQMLAAAASARGGGGAEAPTGRRPNRANPFFNRYKINLLVDNSETTGAPVIYENHPIYQNLVGRSEYAAQMGALITDFTLIKPGALHRANGGYLLLDARDVLQQPYAWEGLKRALFSGEIRIESLGQLYSIVSTVSLEPEPIPLNVKIILLGERILYYLLYQADPDFRELFKVMADFEDQMDRNESNNQAYARFIAAIVEREELRHFDRGAVARVIEHSARLVGDAEKLSAHLQSVADLLREADYWAGEDNRDLVTAADVQQAIDAHTYRSGRLRERMQESILRDTVLIDTSGEKVGQINGLSVITVGDFMFGRPSRITARVRLGKGEVVDIERQVELGGPIHSKGVLILSGFLGGRFAEKRPLSLAASLVFEQSYGGIEGDSASSAELYALLSALAEAPIAQSLAVTGSVNQHGQVQAIGGVNEKIEGFFDVCKARGLTGEQGVLIPESNVKNLMLRPDVVEAVAAGQFHVYPVATIDQGIEILTGIPAGEADAEGDFPDGTINARVAERLKAFAEQQRDFAHAPSLNGEVTPEEEKETESSNPRGEAA